jgi:hypothetical protein
VKIFFMSRAVLCRLAAIAVLCCSSNVNAGNQKEEALADSVRIALSNAFSEDLQP